ncbi:MAG: chromosome segregation protein SMC, partial [Pseudomonadota bacterium]|nr:chromosome segregation protein SMC [Pseudomonadota bacterium]
AIRWVMGESSARQLRGDAMSDVIFAGTSQRKPVGQASVELVFENTFGKLGGAYNDYTELSVRRQVTRDGRSDYFLNGQRCRRRDITDIFLGTGLGSRSYAVIQQGMINRLVEAKPDDLRVFLEEAAGVSRYQSRRRETEQHLEHTRLNLSRLQDVADELASQMRSLRRQSQAAERYRALQAEQRQLQLEVWSQQYWQIEQQQQQHTAQLGHWGAQLRELREQQAETEQAWQRVSEMLSELLAQAEPEQVAWQQAEQALAQAQSKSDQAEQQQQQITQQLVSQQAQDQQLLAQIDQDQHNLQQLHVSVQHLTQALSELPDEQHQQQLLQQLEQDWQALQQQYQQQQQRWQQLQQRQQRLQQQQQTLEKQQQRAQQHIQQLQQQQQQLAIESLESTLQQLTQQWDSIQQQLEQHWLDQQQLEQRQQARQVQRDQQQQILMEIQQRQAAGQAECQALRHIQQEEVAVDLSQTLLSQLQLSDAGQQYAPKIEALLARWLLALPESAEWPDRGQADYRAGHATIVPLSDPRVHPLTDWILSPCTSLWAGVGVVADEAIATALRGQLQAGQSLLTLTGFWVGIDWRLNVQQSTEDQRPQGLLTRQLRLAELEQQQQTDQALLHAAQQTQHHLMAEIEQLAQQWQQQQQQIKQQQATQRSIEIERAQLQSRLQAQQQQREQLEQQLNGWLTTQADDQAELNELHLEVASVALKLQPLQAQIETLQQARDQQ